MRILQLDAPARAKLLRAMFLVLAIGLGYATRSATAAEVGACSPTNRGNLCEEYEVCSGWGGNKVCRTTFTYYLP
jgi:hypothetical protein